MPEPMSSSIRPTTAASSIPPVTGTGSDTVGLPASGTAAGVPSHIGGYVLLNELGRGGMGVVYRAEDPRLKREVAIKLMLPQFAANPQARARFIREARAQAKVEHDHVAVIHQVEEHEGLPYLVMPLLKGMTLHTALKANPRPPLPEVIRIGRETAEGLAAAHEKGLIHRDIKPANIWLEGKKLRVKILDFGLARVATDDTADSAEAGPVTREGAILGTPSYMSPEQGRASAVDHRTDLWSLGVVLYQMTTGQLPFQGTNTIAILTSLALDNPQPPITLNPAVPPALSDFIMRLLAKSPAYRPLNAEAAAEELRAIEAGLVNAVRVIPLDAPPPLIVGTEGTDPFANLDATEVATSENPPRTPTERSRRFPVWGLVGALLLAAAGITGVVLSQLPKKTQPSDTAKEEKPEANRPVVQPVPPPKPPSGPRSCIILWLGGGPSQLETFDPKPGNAGFAPIDTTVPGFQVCSTLPRLAKQAQHLAVIRSLSHREADHNGGAYLMQTGHSQADKFPYPSLSCVLAKELSRPGLPRHVSLGREPGKKKEPGDEEIPLGLGPGILGEEYRPFYLRPMTVPPLATFTEFTKAEAEQWRQTVSSANDYTKKKPEVVAAYGTSQFGQNCLMAARLVELGVPVVEITHGGWDHHSQPTESHMARSWGWLDEGWSALLQDLASSGALRNTLIVCMGEFGRTPTRNANGGRDHWSQGFSVVLAGGLIKGGRVVGRTSDAGKLLTPPVSPAEFLATIYAAVGIDPNRTNPGPNGIEVPLVEPGTKPVAELLP